MRRKVNDGEKPVTFQALEEYIFTLAKLFANFPKASLCFCLRGRKTMLVVILWNANSPLVADTLIASLSAASRASKGLHAGL